MVKSIALSSKTSFNAMQTDSLLAQSENQGEKASHQLFYISWSEIKINCILGNMLKNMPYNFTNKNSGIMQM